jgi:hypothetical protein
MANQFAITAVTAPAPGRTRRCCADRLAAISPAEATASGPAPERRPTSGWCVACARAARAVMTTVTAMYLNNQLHVTRVLFCRARTQTARRAQAEENS